MEFHNERVRPARHLNGRCLGRERLECRFNGTGTSSSFRKMNLFPKARSVDLPTSRNGESSYFTIPPRAHPSASSPSGSAAKTCLFVRIREKKVFTRVTRSATC